MTPFLLTVVLAPCLPLCSCLGKGSQGHRFCLLRFMHMNPHARRPRAGFAKPPRLETAMVMHVHRACLPWPKLSHGRAIPVDVRW
jgi:hypothetical protein